MLEDGGGGTYHLHKKERRAPEIAAKADSAWKSDFDLRLGAHAAQLEALTVQVKAMREAVDTLNSLLQFGRGSMAVLFCAARVTTQVGIVIAGLAAVGYGARKWLLG